MKEMEGEMSERQRDGVKERLVANKERETETINRQKINPIRLTEDGRQ